MKTLRTTRVWILICSLIVVSSATKHPSAHHDGPSHHGNHPQSTKHQDTIVPHGIQIPEHVSSTQDVACISADSNIFEIMKKAQESCKGNDLECTFYHLMNHEYHNIGTTGVNKELFDELLMKFDNWLLTTENIEEKNDGVTLHEEGTSLHIASVHENGKFSSDTNSTANISKTESRHTNHGVHIDQLDHNANETDNAKVHTHHLKKLHEPHHSKDIKVLGDEWNNKNYIVKDAEYNKDHKYFEVFLPKDKDKGKPKTIYVEIDKDKNEFVLLDEEINKKLYNDKPIKIELDVLSDVADTAFNDVVKTSKHKEHHDNYLTDDEKAMTSDISSNSAVHEDETNLDLEPPQNHLHPSVSIPNMSNLDANQHLIPDDTTENIDIVNVSKNLIVPNNYINLAQLNVETQLDNLTDDMPNHHFELLESTKHETDTHQTYLDEETPLDASECYDNSNNTYVDLDNIGYSRAENVVVRHEVSENYELSTEHTNVTNGDENDDIDNDFDIKVTNDFSSSGTQLNGPMLQATKPFQDNKLTSTPLTTDHTSRISDYSGSHLDPIPLQKLSKQTVLQNVSPVPNVPPSPYTTVPILGKDLAKVLETDPHLQSSFPMYAISDISQNTQSNSDSEHPTITSCSTPQDYVVGHSSTAPNINQYTSPIFPSPPVECGVRLKGSENSPFNAGCSWLPSHSSIDELRLPSATDSLSLDRSPQNSISPLSEKEFHDSTRTITIEDERVPSLAIDLHEASLPTEPFHYTNTQILPKDTILPSLIPNTFNRIPTTSKLCGTPLSVTPSSLNSALISPSPIQQNSQSLPCFPTKDNLGFLNQMPFDTSSCELLPILDKKETMIPCSPYTNRYLSPTIPYTANVYLKPPCLEPLWPVTSLRPVPKIPALNSLPLPLNQNCPCTNGDYPQESNPISPPSTPNTPFSPLNPQLLGSGFFPNTLPYSNLWNNIPYRTFPCSLQTMLLDQDMRINPPPTGIDNLPPGDILDNKVPRLYSSKTNSLKCLEQPYLANNNFEVMPSIYAPFLSVNTLPVEIALERDLQGLSLKYGIPLSNILKNLATEISDANTYETPLKSIYSKEMEAFQQVPTLSTTNGVVDYENRSGNKELLSDSDLTNFKPLDSTLIGPHLNMESPSKILDSYNSQINTFSAQTKVPLPSPHPSIENQATVLDSSLIGPHLSTLHTNNSFFSDEDQTGKEMIQTELDSSHFQPLDSSLIGPHLELGSPPVVEDLNNLDVKSFSIQPDETSTTQVKSQLKNLQNKPSISSLDSSLIETHMSTLSAGIPLLNGGKQIINKMLPPELDFTELTPIDSSQLDFVNELAQYKKPVKMLSPAISGSKLHKSTVYSLSDLTRSESDSSSLIPLDSTLIGSHLDLENAPNIKNTVNHKPVPAVSQDNLLNTDDQIEEMESIILPSSLLPTLLDTPVKADSNRNIHNQDTKFNKQSLDTIAELPQTDISLKTPLTSFKETDFKIIERTPDLLSIGSKVAHLSSKDSATLQHKIMSPEISDLDYETQLESSLIGSSLFHKGQTPKTSTALDSSLKGPALYREIESQETSTVLDSATELESSLVGPSLYNTVESSNTAYLDSKSELDTSLKGPSLLQDMESLEISRAVDAKNQLNSSLIGPNLETMIILDDEIKMKNEELQLGSSMPLDSSLIGPSIFGSGLKQSVISRHHNPETKGSDLVEEESPLEPIMGPSISTSGVQELSSKYTKLNSIYKFHPSPYEIQQSDKLLSSTPKSLPTNPDLQTSHFNPPLSFQKVASKFCPITEYLEKQELPPKESVVNGYPFIESDYFPTPKTLAESPSDAQGLPYICVPFTSFVQKKPLMYRNWQEPQPLNILQASSGLRPGFNVAPWTSNDKTELYPTRFISEINAPVANLLPPTVLTSPSNILPLNKYDSSLSNNPSVISSSSKSAICNSEYSPMVLDDITQVDEGRFQSLKDMSVLPVRQFSLTSPVPETEKGEMVSPTLLEEMRLLLPVPITNPMAQSSIYNPQIGLNNLQNTYMIQKPIIPQSNLQCTVQPSHNVPLKAQFSEILGPPLKTVLVPTESPKTYLESEFYEIPNIQRFVDSVTNPKLDSEFLQQPLSEPCLESLKVLPSSSPDTKLQITTASNDVNNIPYQLPPVSFTPISSFYTTPLSNAFMGPLSPTYSRPLLASYAKPISVPTTTSVSNVPYVASPLIPLQIPTHPYSVSPFVPDLTSPLIPVKTCKPSTTFFSPYLPFPSKPILAETSPYSSNMINGLKPTISNLYSPAYDQPISKPICKTVPISLSNLRSPEHSSPLTLASTSPMVSTPTDLLSPYVGPVPFNTLMRPSSLLSPAYLNPTSLVTASLPLNERPLSPNFQLTTPELQLLRLLNTVPISDAVNPFLYAYQMPLTNPKRLPIQSSCSQTKENIPYDDKMESNLQTPLSEERPYFGKPEEMICTYSNNKGDQYYKEQNFKYPLESLACTLAPDETTEPLLIDDLIGEGNFIPCAPVDNLTTAPGVPQSKSYQDPYLTPYTPLHSKPLLRPCSAAQPLPPTSLIYPFQQNIYDNIPLMPFCNSLKAPVTAPTSILYSPLLKPPSPLIPAPNFPSQVLLSTCPCKDIPVCPYNVLPMNKKQSLSSPYYSATIPDIISNIILPQVTSDFSQIPTNAHFTVAPSSINKPAIKPPTVPYIPDNYILISPPSQISLRPSLTPLYDKYLTSITSPAPPLEVPIVAQSLKPTKPHLSPQYVSSILPTTTLREMSPLYEAPTYYQPYTSPALTCSEKNVLQHPPVTLPYTESPSLNNIVQPCRNLNSPQWCASTPQISLPISLSTPAPSTTVLLSNLACSELTPHIAMQPLTNNIIPSSLFMIPDTNFQTPKSKLSPSYSNPRYSLPSLALTEPLEAVPCYTPNRPLEKMGPAPIILKPSKYTVPLSSLPYLTQPLQNTDSYPTQPVPIVPFPTQSQSKTLPVLSQYAAPSTSYTSSPLQKFPYQQINEPIVPQYTLPSASLYDPSIKSPYSARNPFINSGLNPGLEIPSYPAPNLISSPNITPLDSVILSNILRPVDISKKSLNSCPSPITCSVPLSSSSFIPLAKILNQKSRQFQPEFISDPKLLPSTNHLLESPLLKPLLSTSQNYAPLLPMHCSTLKPVISKKYLPSVSDNDKYISPSDSLVSELPDTLESIRPASIIPYNLLKSPLNQQYHSPVFTLGHAPLYSNYNILESSPKLPNTVKPIEVSSNSAPELLRLSPRYLEAEMVEAAPYEIRPDLMDGLSPLSISCSQQRSHSPTLNPRYLLKPHPSPATSPLQDKFSKTSQYPTETVPLLDSPVLLSDDETELIDNSNFIPISPIQSNPLISSYFPTDIKEPLITNASSSMPPLPSNVLQSSPYTLVNTEFPHLIYKKLLTKKQTRPRSQSSPVYISPQEYQELIQVLPSSYALSSSPNVLTSPNTGPQMNIRPFPNPQIPLYMNQMSIKPQNWLQSPFLTKFLPLSETPIEVKPEKENLPIDLNKYRPFNKTPLGINNFYEPEITIAEKPLKQEDVKQTAPVNSWFKLEPSPEYEEALHSNENIDYDPDNVMSNENVPDISEVKLFNKAVPEVKGLIAPYINKIVPNPHRLSKLDHFYENNHIGTKSQVFTVPTSNTLLVGSYTDVTNPSVAVPPENIKHFTNTPTKHFGSVPKLDTKCLGLNDYYPEILDSPTENPAVTISCPKNFLNPQFKYLSTTMELPETPSASYPYNNIKDIKYSGYKTYQIPCFKSPQVTKNLGPLPQIYSSMDTQSSSMPVVPPSRVHQISGLPNFNKPTEYLERQIPLHQRSVQGTTPHQTKLDHNNLEESPELYEYSNIVDVPTRVDNINEDNELKTSLINYINKKEGIKDNLYNNDKELTIPLGNIALIKKEPSNADTIETNNPSIGLKVWKSNIKLAQAELKLKFKDLSVNNFMPVVNNLDKYDVEEIRKIVKNYIDEKYGNHIEVNEPYTIDNKYTVLENFDHNGSDNKYNLLWPTNYV